MCGAPAHGAGRPASGISRAAAAAPDQFYGQLALERLGRRVEPPLPAAAPPSQAERAAFANRSLAAATRALGQMGQWSDQSLFIRALAQQAETDQERAMTAEYGRQIGRPDLGVWVAREARAKGANYYARLGFPEVQIPAGNARHWTIAHAIIRQESSFDRAAVSHAGARGMMQLMPHRPLSVGKLAFPTSSPA